SRGRTRRISRQNRSVLNCTDKSVLRPVRCPRIRLAMTNLFPAVGVVAFLLVIWLVQCVSILREYERAVVFRLGRLVKQEKGPGLVFIFWPIDQLVRVSLRV